MKLDRLTQKSQEALRDAHDRALSAGHPEIDPEHLLLALVEQADGVVPAVLSKAGADADGVARDVRRDLDRRPRVEGGAEPAISRRLRKAIEAAESAAKDRRDEYVSTEHLLLGTLAEGGGAAAEALERNGAARAAVETALQAVRGAHRVTDPEPEGKYASLEKYTIDLTDRARKGKIDPVV